MSTHAPHRESFICSMSGCDKLTAMNLYLAGNKWHYHPTPANKITLKHSVQQQQRRRQPQQHNSTQLVSPKEKHAWDIKVLGPCLGRSYFVFRRRSELRTWGLLISIVGEFAMANLGICALMVLHFLTEGSANPRCEKVIKKLVDPLVCNSASRLHGLSAPGG